MSGLTALANAAIARTAAAGAPRPLHIVDLGVSHGVQWPTLLESLTRMPGGRAPPSVRLTVVAAGTLPAPFSASPSGYDFSPHLLRYAKSINLPLAISRAACLDSVHSLTAPSEALVVCFQFRLGHATADEPAGILNKVRGLNPELVVLSEVDGGGGDGIAAGRFAARLELLWRFLESTSAAFKGRDGEERRRVEAVPGPRRSRPSRTPTNPTTSPSSAAPSSPPVLQHKHRLRRDKRRAARISKEAAGGAAANGTSGGGGGVAAPVVSGLAAPVVSGLAQGAASTSPRKNRGSWKV